MNSEKGSSLRRESVTHLSAGLAGVALTGAVPAVEGRVTKGSVAAPFVDPTTKAAYPGQPQPWPGLAGKMNTRPDYGETTYKGPGRLIGRNALITGGDSGWDVPQRTRRCRCRHHLLPDV